MVENRPPPDKCTIGKQVFTIPVAQWQHLGEPTYVMLWYQGYDTLVTAAGARVRCPNHAFRPHPRRMRLRFRRCLVDWFWNAGRQLVVWKLGIYPVESIELHGVPAVRCIGTNSLSIDFKELNEFHETNARLLDSTDPGSSRSQGLLRSERCTPPQCQATDPSSASEP